MRDRRACATCQHVAAVRDVDGRFRFRCMRLGWETRPGWRFACWQERPASTPMPKLPGLPAAPDPGDGAKTE